MAKTRKNRTRGWKRQGPGRHERTLMLKRCGRKCFLGPGISYPICTKKTCSINMRGVQSAYNRSRQFHKRNISKKAFKILHSKK